MKRKLATQITAIGLSAIMAFGTALSAQAAKPDAVYGSDIPIVVGEAPASANTRLPSSIKPTKEPWVYTGNVITPTFTVKDGGKVVDFSVWNLL